LRHPVTEPTSRTFVAEDDTGLVGFASVGPPVAGDLGSGEKLCALQLRRLWVMSHALLTLPWRSTPHPCGYWPGTLGLSRSAARTGSSKGGATRTDECNTEVRMVRVRVPRRSSSNGAAELGVGVGASGQAEHRHQSSGHGSEEQT
jgi:hypothetical protein